MTPLEKTARAVLGELKGRKGVGNELRAIEDADPEIYAEIEQAIGRAAIESLMEPTSEMTIEGAKQMFGSSVIGEPQSAVIYGQPKDILQAMLRRALEHS